MMETKTTPFDFAEILETPEGMAAYWDACIQESEGDAAFIAKALGDIARAKGDDSDRTRDRAVAGKYFQGTLW
jgi:probable addiction module antidote protein